MIKSWDIDDAPVLVAIGLAFDDYERALLAGDHETLDGYFWDDARVVRYGVAENLYGAETIAEFRRQWIPPAATRELRNRVITAFGPDLATAVTEFRWPGESRWDRQSQVWVHMAGGWRIVSAHVSMMVGP